DRCALWLVEMTYAFGAPLVSNHIDVITHALAVADMIAFSLGITAGLENRLIGTLWKAGPAGNAFVRNQKRHITRLLLACDCKTMTTATSKNSKNTRLVIHCKNPKNFLSMCF